MFRSRRKVYAVRRLISWLIMVPALIAVTVFALNNKTSLVLDLWPFGLAIEMPVYLAFLLALAMGAVLGGVAAWLGQSRARGAFRGQAYEGEVARRELNSARETIATLQQQLDQKADASSPIPKQETLLPPKKAS